MKPNASFDLPMQSLIAFDPCAGIKGASSATTELAREGHPFGHSLGLS